MTFQFRSPLYSPGPVQRRILARAHEDGGFINFDRENEKTSARKLHENGFLDRHTKISSAYRINDYGLGYMQHINHGATL